MSAELLAVIGVSKAVWANLPSKQKQQIRAQFKKGNRGMAKILTGKAKKISFVTKKKIAKRKQRKR